MKGINYFLRIALNEAEKAFDSGDVPIGAVVAVKDVIVGRGRNRSYQRYGLLLRHAEIEAIEGALLKLETGALHGAVLYTSVMPCVMCAGAAYHAGIERIYYGAENGELERIPGARELVCGFLSSVNIELYGGFLAGEAALLMRRFFKELR